MPTTDEIGILRTKKNWFVVCAILSTFCLYFIYAVFLPSEPHLVRLPQPRSVYHMLNHLPITTESASTVVATIEPIKNCTAWKTVVFIKTHKTGSTTLQTIINRFGFFNNLSFVFNRRSSENGHFYFIPVTSDSPATYFLPPLKVRTNDLKRYTDYDMLAVHVRYNRTAMNRFMKKGTKYISIIREPSTQWESAFNQFLFEEALPNASAIPSESWFDKFLEKPSYYREKLRFLPYEGVMGRRWYYAQNNQMYDLGLDTGPDFYDEAIINATIRRLEDEFTLILIMEYFDESLLILKRDLCWDFNDIVYLTKNSRISKRNLTDTTRKKIREFNHADVLLYEHFNRTLWRKVKEYGHGFEKDLRYFRQLNREVFHRCGNTEADVIKQGKRMLKFKEFTPKTNVSLFCRTVAEHKQELFQRIYDRQNPFSTNSANLSADGTRRKEGKTTSLQKAHDTKVNSSDVIKPKSNTKIVNRKFKSPLRTRDMTQEKSRIGSGRTRIRH